MDVRTLPHRRPVPTLATVLFVVVFAVTAAYFAGLVPGVPKTLPTFTRLVVVAVVLLAIAVLAWAVSLGSH